MSPNIMQITNGSNGAAHFGSGKVNSNNGSSSGGSVFSGVAKQSGNHWGQRKFVNDSVRSGCLQNSLNLVHPLRSGSKLGGQKGLKMSR